LDDFERADGHTLGPALIPATAWYKTNGGSAGAYKILLSNGRLEFRIDTAPIGAMNTRLVVGSPLPVSNTRLRARVERSSCDGHIRALLNTDNVVDPAAGFGFNWGTCAASNALQIWTGSAGASAPIELAALNTPYFVQVTLDAAATVATLTAATGGYPGEQGHVPVGSAVTANGPFQMPGSTVYINAGGENAKNAGKAWVHEIELAVLPAN
jgi:hypothetical protein